ncbi:hypothetical protein ACFL1H_05500 [Nanoarchaeota archaeon]
MTVKEKFLDDLGGKEREIIVPNSSLNEKLFKHCTDMMNTYEYTKRNYIFPNTFHEKGIQIYEQLKKEIDFKFNINQFNDFILNYSDIHLEEDKKKVFGCCTSALFKLAEKGIEVYLNGQGKRFDYLLHHLTEFDDLILDNFKGKELLSHAISRDEKGGSLIIANSDLDRSGMQFGTQGSFDTLTLLNCNINASFYNLSNTSDSYANTIIVANSRGDGGFYSICEKHGKLELFLYAYNNFEEFGYRVGGEGQIKKIFALHNKGKKIFEEAGVADDFKLLAADFNGTIDDGNIDLILAANNESKQMLEKCKCKSLKLYNNKGWGIGRATKVKKDKINEDEYNQILTKNNLHLILDYFKYMQGKTYSYQNMMDVLQLVEEL